MVHSHEHVYIEVDTAGMLQGVQPQNIRLVREMADGPAEDCVGHFGLDQGE